MEAAKMVMLAKRIFDGIEKHGWKRVSGAMCVSIISVFLGIGFADVSHVWINGHSVGMDQLHISYLWQLAGMFVGVYILKHVVPHTTRLLILLLFKKDSGEILKLFMEVIEVNEPTTGGIDNPRDPNVPQT